MTSNGGMGSQAIDIQDRFVNALRKQAESPRDRCHLEHSVSPRGSQPPHMVSTKPTRSTERLAPQTYDSRYSGLLLQPSSKPISQEQLASEVKSIYAGLTMVETKCIHVDRAQVQVTATSNESKLATDHWQALIALHRTLLHEHHDFFLASQHPSASPALQRLAKKYSMPARMWKHGIHSFLELLRQRILESIDYMLAFIYLAYQMMAMLYETVPDFEDTWIECLGDLGRYRMAIEDEDIRDREPWAGVARSWYSKAADKNPTVGRLYHHLAILARPNALQQLYYYARSLTCVKPFTSARESILNLLDPILGRSTAEAYAHALPIDTNFIEAHGLLFGKSIPFEHTRLQFHSEIDSHTEKVTVKLKERGVSIAATKLPGCFEYGADDPLLRQKLELHSIFHQEKLPEEHHHLLSLAPDYGFGYSRASNLVGSTIRILSRRIWTKNVLPQIHVLLTFMSFSVVPTATALPLLNHHTSRAEERRTTYSDDSVGDWIISGILLMYLVGAYWYDPKTRKLALLGSVTSATFWTAIVSEGDRPEFPSHYRWNILKTWAATTTALTCQAIKSSVETANCGIPAPLNASRSESITYRFLFHLFSIFGLVQVTGMAIQNFEKGSFLNAVPPSFSIANLITSRLIQKATQHSRVATEHAPTNSVRTDFASNFNSASPSLQEPANGSLPNPSHFALNEDGTDLESLAGTYTQNTRPTPLGT